MIMKDQPPGDTSAVRTSLIYFDPADHPRAGDVYGRLVLNHPDHPDWPREGEFVLSIVTSVHIAEDVAPLSPDRPMPPATLAQAREIVENVRERLVRDQLVPGIRVVLGVWLVGPHDRLITDRDLPRDEPADSERPRLVGMIHNVPTMTRAAYLPGVDPDLADVEQIEALLAEEVQRFDEYEHGEHHAWALVQCLGSTWERVTPISPAYATPELAQRAADAALAVHPSRLDQDPYAPGFANLHQPTSSGPPLLPGLPALPKLGVWPNI